MTVPHPVPTDHIAPEDVLRKWPKTPEKGGYNTDFPCGCKFYHDFGRALAHTSTARIQNFMSCERHSRAPVAYPCGCEIHITAWDGKAWVDVEKAHYFDPNATIGSQSTHIECCPTHRQYLFEVHW